MSSETDRFIGDVRLELDRARAKFPGRRLMVIALAEEIGELAKAMLEESSDRVWKEAVQTAVMAARVAVDGDESVDGWRAEKALDPVPAVRSQEANPSAECGASYTPVAAKAISDRFMYPPTSPFSGFIVAIDQINQGITIYCKRHPSTAERDECRRLAGGVPVSFVESRGYPLAPRSTSNA